MAVRERRLHEAPHQLGALPGSSIVQLREGVTGMEPVAVEERGNEERLRRQEGAQQEVPVVAVAVGTEVADLGQEGALEEEIPRRDGNVREHDSEPDGRKLRDVRLFLPQVASVG